MTVNGLVLQGGGALGAFERGAIECLLDSGIKPDVVSGTSIGAINATVLCGHRAGDPKTGLRDLWHDLTTPGIPLLPDAVNENISTFGNPGMYQLRTDYWDFMRWTSFYETLPLLATLDAHVDFGKLKPADGSRFEDGRASRLILTATNLFTGKLEKFDSDKMQITPHHVRASGSLPPSFPATKATAPPGSGGTEHLYWDGGLFDNTPLSMVIEALQESDDHDKRLYVITLFPSATAAAPENLHEVFTRMMTLAFSNKMAKDMKRARQTTELIKLGIELDKMIDAHPELSRLRNLPGYQVLKKFAAPIKIVEIMNPTVAGASDFSAQGIERRRESGYQATAARLEEEDYQTWARPEARKRNHAGHDAGSM